MVRASHNSVNWIFSFSALFIFLTGNVIANKEGYYGKYIGKLSQLHHGVSGDVYAVDARTLHLRNFNYDGEGPAAYFFAGNSKSPGVNGFRLRDERGTTNVLPRYRNKHITVTLPEGKTLQNIKWFSVWCEEFSVNFGDVKIPKNLDFPKPQKISGLSGVHGVSSEPIVIVDAQTLLIPSFSYDGEAPDAKFWVGPGTKPTPQGIRIPDENGKEVPLRRYDRKTIVLTLPGDLNIFDIGHFGVWCEAFTVDFGHVQIPRGLNIPPSLKMLGVSPQSKLNCEVLWDDFAYEVRWAVAGDSIVLQLVARLENNEYMSFGLSGDKSKSRMVGGDVVVAWVDKESLKGYAEDYYLDAKSQCSGGRGSCPDENIAEGAGSVRLLNAALVNGYSIVTYQRSLKAQDTFDHHVFTNGSQPIIWAIGPLNSRKEVSYHSLSSRGDIFIDFGRAPKWNCPTPESTPSQSESDESSSYISETKETRIHESRNQDDTKHEPSSAKKGIQTPAPASVPKSRAWEIPSIKCYEPEDGVFYAQMGPTGGKHGYSAITGHVGWGISWYINGLLIPEINVVRGRTYTFIVEGGLDPETPARYHPFYITDDPVGGYQYKTPEERANIQIFAGAVQNKKGEVRPTGIGRLCNWTPDPNQPPADEFTSFGAYQRTLRLECDPGNPGIIQWTVDKDTPDTVYYQCYTHRYLGWKINVHDDCENGEASEPIPSVVKPPFDFDEFQQTDSKGAESINYEVRVKPDETFIQEKKLTNSEPNRITTFPHQVESYKNQFDKGKFEEETSTLKNSFTSPINHAGYKVREESEAPILQTPSRPLHSLYSEVGILQHPQLFLQPSLIPNDEKILQISAITPVPSATLYGIFEETPNEKVQNIFKNFQILPIPAKIETSTVNNLKNHKVREELTKEKPIFPTLHAYEQAKYGENIFKNYNRGIPSEDKFNKHVDYRAKIPSRLSNRVRKPSHHGTFTFQRPHPPGAVRVPYEKQKRPTVSASTVQSVKIPNSNHLTFGLSHNKYKKHQEESSLALFNHLSGSKTVQPNHYSMRFAQNTGFDPGSIKVEGGFKPIIGTRIPPKLNLIDRADTDVEDDDTATNEEPNASDATGKKSLTEESYTFFESRQDKNGKNQQRNIEETNEKKKKIFKDTKPEMFEPMFIPSFPDHGFKKFQEKNKKKTGIALKHRSDLVDSDKGQDIYVRYRPNSNLIPRPFYPEDIVPRFRIPVYGKTPQFRNTQNSEEQEIEEENVDAFNIYDEETTRNSSSANSSEVSDVNVENDKLVPTNDASDTEKSEVEQDETAVADETKGLYSSLESRKYLSYDGKTVTAESVTTFPQFNSSFDVTKVPQSIPYRGVVPSLSKNFDAQNLPQLRNSKISRQEILPEIIYQETKNNLLAKNSSNQHEVNDSNTESAPVNIINETQVTQKKNKRSADHIPGHVGHDNHDQDHDHHNHKHDHHFTNNGIALVSNLLFIVLTFVSHFV